MHPTRGDACNGPIADELTTLVVSSLSMFKADGLRVYSPGAGLIVNQFTDAVVEVVGVFVTSGGELLQIARSA